MREGLDSAGERFTREQVLRILRLGERQLSAWERQGLVQPSESWNGKTNGAIRRADEDPPPVSGHPPRPLAKNPSQSPTPALRARSRRAPPPAAKSHFYYTFSDLVTLKTLLELRKRGVPPAKLRSAHEALRRKLAEVKKPWSELQIRGSGKNLIVQFQGRHMEAITGQLLLEYAPETGRQTGEDGSDGSINVQRFKRGSRRKKHTAAAKRTIAERFFMAGLKYEEEPGAKEKAIQAYQRAIEMNPEAVGAYINLGTIYYNLRQLEAAERCYQSALSIDPGYVLVHFNLGNVADEKNDLPNARLHYEEAVRLDPSYPDPHYNLALIYEKLGFHGKARQQWLRYLKLDQQSRWAAYARLQLERTPLRLIPSIPTKPGTGKPLMDPRRPSGSKH